MLAVDSGSDIQHNVLGLLMFMQVSVSFSSSQVSPADTVSVQVSASPGSYVGLLAVDQSVLLLKNDNDLSTDAVSGILATHLQLQFV